MNIVRKSKELSNIVRVIDMKQGDVGVVVEWGPQTSYRGRVILCAYQQYIDLGDPDNTWDRGSLTRQSEPDKFRVRLVNAELHITEKV